MLLLEAKNISKTYIDVQVLKEVNFSLKKGEVHALCGSNGAGKSTLIKILTGAIHPTNGTVNIEGKTLSLGSPITSLNEGIACVYQKSNLVHKMSVADNILMGKIPTNKVGMIDKKRQIKWVSTLLNQYHLELEPMQKVNQLSTVKQKEVEIAKALSYNSKIILMDEPTAWLSNTEANRLFDIILLLKNNGVGIVYISHILDDIYKICDRISVLRNGEMIKTGKIQDISKKDLIHLMVGRLLDDGVINEKNTLNTNLLTKQQFPILEVKNLRKKKVFQDISFKVHKGEIVTITGLIGSKRSEVLRAIFGADPVDEGQIYLLGKKMNFKNPVHAIHNKIGFVCEDRHKDGLILQLSIAHNIVLSSLKKISSYPFIGGIIDKKMMQNLSDKQIKQLNIVPKNRDLITAKLSGGNQQKVLISRWLTILPEVIILDEPTVGVDVGAKTDIYQLLNDLAKAGKGVLVVSSDIEEVLKISHRILIMVKGKIVQSFTAKEATQDKIVQAMGNF